MNLLNPHTTSGDGWSHDGQPRINLSYYRWRPVQGGDPRSRQLVDHWTGEVVGVCCYLPLLGVWTGRLCIPGHETRSCTRMREHQARAWVVVNVRQHRRPPH